MSTLPGLGPVLHPTDFSDGAGAAFPYSLYLAALAGADLHVLHVRAADGAEADAAVFPSRDEEAERVGRWLGDRFGPRGRDAGGTPPASDVLPTIHREVREDGDPASEILSYAAEVDAGAFCLGTRGRQGVRRLVLGSVAEGVIRRAREPVLTVRREIRGWPEAGPRRLLVGVDLSPMMEPALAWAGLMAAATGAELTAVHVVTSRASAVGSGKRQRIHRTFEELDLTGVELETELVAGDPASRIVEVAEEDEVDLIVTATHGRSGPSRLVLGSASESLVRRAPCPVLTVSDPPPGHGSERGGEAAGER